MEKSAPKFTDYVLLVLLAAIFASSFLFTKIAVAEIPAAILVSFRLVIASLIFFVAMLVSGQAMPRFGRIWIPIFGAALFGNALPFFLIAWGQAKVDAGLAAILMATMPLMTIVMAHFVTRDEKLNRWKVIGFCFGLLGVAVMIGLDKLATLGDQTVRQYAIIGGALCYAASAIITKYLVHLPRLSMMCSLMILSTLLILPIGLMNGGGEIITNIVRGDSAISFKTMFATLILGIVPTAIGTIMVFVIVKRQGASFLSQINFMVPVLGVVWGILFLSETLPSNAMIALGLILAGVAIARINSNTELTKYKETNS